MRQHQSIAMLLVFSSATLFVISFVAAIGHELLRSEERGLRGPPGASHARGVCSGAKA